MLQQSFAKDIYTKWVNTVNENDTLSRCLEFFKTERPQVLAVVDMNDNYVGVITRRWILRSKVDPMVTKVKSLMKSAPRLTPNDTVSKIARLMIESGIRQLPIFENEQLLGFVTDENVISAAVSQEWGKGKVSSVMTRAPYTIDTNRTVGAVINLFREQGFSHVPVMDAGKVVGIISIRDVLERIFQSNERQTKGDRMGKKIETFTIPASSIMSSPIISVDADTNLREAEKKMQKYNISCLAATLNDRLVGIITKLDLLESISQSETITPSLTIQFGVKDTRITKDQQDFMMTEFDAFTRKYQEAFQSGTLFVYIKTHGTSNTRETPFVHCRLQFRTTKGTFVSSGESWGIEATFRTAIDRMDRRLLRSKELSYNPRYAKDYLHKMGLPDEEL
ncbi:MAG: CBS domain-containing protein [Nitrososphaerota archaeon]|jgi:CBS domain-containing protein|nr:CBS domain-containing protein [Nitrososphaerota archaeon]